MSSIGCASFFTETICRLRSHLHALYHAGLDTKMFLHGQGYGTGMHLGHRAHALAFHKCLSQAVQADTLQTLKVQSMLVDALCKPKFVRCACAFEFGWG